MTWFKVIVILAWVSVPVGGSIMLRSSYHDYLADSVAQREDCLERSALLNNYIALTGHLAGQVQLIDSVAERQEWERAWAAMQRQLLTEQQGLRPNDPVHYPETDAKLSKAEGLLTDQMELVKESVWKRDAYLKSASGMFELGQQIVNTKLTAHYYRRIGAEGIYLRIQEDLAQLEEVYNQRNRDRSRLNLEVSDRLNRADRMRRDVLWILNHLEDQLAADERLTYKSRLKRHLQEFQLRQELRRLVEGTPS